MEGSSINFTENDIAEEENGSYENRNIQAFQRTAEHFLASNTLHVPDLVETIELIQTMAPNFVPSLQLLFTSYLQGRINAELTTYTIDYLRDQATRQFMEELLLLIRLTEEQIEEQMERHVHNVSNVEEVEECCICLEDFCNNDETGKLDCGHQFHYNCIKKWLKVKNSCPLCQRIALAPPEP